MNSLTMSMVIVIACGTYGMVETLEDFTARAGEMTRQKDAPRVAGELGALNCRGDLLERFPEYMGVFDTMRIERDREDTGRWNISYSTTAESLGFSLPGQILEHTASGVGDDSGKALGIAASDVKIEVERDGTGAWRATFKPTGSKSVFDIEPMVCIAYGR